MSWGGYLPQESCQGGDNTSTVPMVAYGRHALSILITEKQIKSIQVPFWICDSVVEALSDLQVSVEYYDINQKLLPNVVDPRKPLLLVNYFGLLDKELDLIASNHHSTLILDSSQAFFSNIKHKYSGFTSLRKFFGVADGAEIFNTKKSIRLQSNIVKTDHLIDYPNLMKFQKYENSIPKKLLLISEFSKSVFKKLNLEKCASKRMQNSQLLHDRLKSRNRLDFETGAPLLYYPFLPMVKIDKLKLQAHECFTPTLWKEVDQRSKSGDFQMSVHLTNNLIPLPVDHRYSVTDMNSLADLITSLI